MPKVPIVKKRLKVSGEKVKNPAKFSKLVPGSVEGRAGFIRVSVSLKIGAEYCSVGTEACVQTESPDYVPDFSDPDGVSVAVESLFRDVSKGVGEVVPDMAEGLREVIAHKSKL